MPAAGREPTTSAWSLSAAGGKVLPRLPKPEPTVGVEPTTYGLRYRCSAN